MCHCLYCSVRQQFYNEQKQSKKQLDLEKIKKIFKEANDLGNKKLQISGGEPLLYKNLIEIIKEAKKYDWFIFINSVGYGINKKLANSLLEAGLSAINISIDSPKAGIHDKWRGLDGLLKQSLNTLKVFAEFRKNDKYKDFYTNIQTIIMRDNYRDLPKLIELALDKGVSAFYLMHVYNYKGRKFSLNEKQIIDFNNNIIPAIISVLKKRKTGKNITENAKNVLDDLFKVQFNTLENYSIGKYWNDLDYIKSICDIPDKTALILAN